MSSSTSVRATVSVQNIGGIDETTVNLESDVSVLAGRNATNRTSLLRAIMGALGSDGVTLKADADEGYVSLDIAGETYTRHLERRNGTVVTDGEPFLTNQENVEVADLFAFLLESNEARRAVTREEDLRELLMRPIDTVAIEREIEKLVAQRDRVDADLEELDELAAELPGLETRRQELREEREALEAELETKRAALESSDDTIEARRAEQSEVDERMDELEDARSAVTRTRQQLRTERDSVESLETELTDLQDELATLPDPPAETGDVDGELSRLRERQDQLETELNELQTIVQFNEKMLDGTSPAVVETLRGEDAATTDELLPDEERNVVCWTCGSEVEQAQLEETVERLSEVRSEKLEDRSEMRSRIQELQDTKREREEYGEKRRRLNRRIEKTKTEIDEREERIEELEEERTELEATVEDLEAAVRDLQTEDQDDLLELNREINQLEFQRDQVENDLDEVEAEIKRIEARLEERDDLEDERADITDRLGERRTRIDRIEADAADQFNAHMEQVLEMLGYENLDRVWIERKERGSETTFDLHVVRTSDGGAAYEDQLDHLSESEREVVGLVFALAGYLVHDVHETVPFLLLDSLEALDSGRIADLVEYFSEYPDCLVVALLPEDAAAVDDDYRRISNV